MKTLPNKKRIRGYLKKNKDEKWQERGNYFIELNWIELNSSFLLKFKPIHK